MARLEEDKTWINLRKSGLDSENGHKTCIRRLYRENYNKYRKDIKICKVELDNILYEKKLQIKNGTS